MTTSGNNSEAVRAAFIICTICAVIIGGCSPPVLGRNADLSLYEPTLKKAVDRAVDELQEPLEKLYWKLAGTTETGDRTVVLLGFEGIPKGLDIEGYLKECLTKPHALHSGYRISETVDGERIARGELDDTADHFDGKPIIWGSLKHLRSTLAETRVGVSLRLLEMVTDPDTDFKKVVVHKNIEVDETEPKSLTALLWENLVPCLLLFLSVLTVILAFNLKNFFIVAILVLLVAATGYTGWKAFAVADVAYNFPPRIFWPQENQRLPVEPRRFIGADVDYAIRVAGDDVDNETCSFYYGMDFKPPWVEVDEKSGVVKFHVSKQRKPGSHLISVKAVDGEGKETIRTFELMVNAPPQITVPEGALVHESLGLQEWEISCFDPDGHDISLRPGDRWPDGMSAISEGKKTGDGKKVFSVKYTPVKGKSGEMVVELVANDISGGYGRRVIDETRKTFTFTVIPELEITGLDKLEFRRGRRYQGEISIAEPDIHPEVGFRLFKGPASISIDSSGLITWYVPCNSSLTGVEITVEAYEGTSKDVETFTLSHVSSATVTTESEYDKSLPMGIQVKTYIDGTASTQEPFAGLLKASMKQGDSRIEFCPPDEATLTVTGEAHFENLTEGEVTVGNKKIRFFRYLDSYLNLRITDASTGTDKKPVPEKGNPVNPRHKGSTPESALEQDLEYMLEKLVPGLVSSIQTKFGI